MKLFSSIRSIVTALSHRARVENETEEELRSHVQNRADDLERWGLMRAEAERRARIEFGAHEKFKEECREALSARFVEVFLQDARFAVRMLRKSPGFTTLAVLTLALGIGANTAIFSLLNGLVLRDLPVPHPQQLVRFGAHNPDDDYTAVSLPMFREFSRRQNVFSQTFVWWGDAVLNAEVNGTLSRADVWCVDGNFYSQLGAVPELGRFFDAQENNLNSGAATQVAVLGYGFWQSRYGGARDVIGKTIKIEGIPYTIIGVASKRFTGISADLELEVTLPLVAEPLISGDPNVDVQKHLQRRDALSFEATGRLKPGMTLEQARVELESLWPGIRREMAPLDKTPEELANFQKLQLKVESGARGGSYARHRFEKPLYVLLAIAGVVLLLACVNLASMMLARAASRRHEMSVRVALGASRARLALQMLTESVALSAMGAVLGFMIAYWAGSALSAFILGQVYIVPASLNLAPDWRILGFTGAVAILTGILFGLAPAWRATREDPHSAIQQTAQRVSSGTGKLGKGLIVTQVALSLVLLTGSGLFIRTLLKLRFAQPGFRTQGVLAIGLYPKPGAYKKTGRVNYYRDLTDRVSGIPGVESAGIVHLTPGNLFEWTEKAHVTDTNAEDVTTDFVMLMPESFRPLGISLLRGRSFNWQDDDHAPHVALISENLAERMFPHGDVIGQHVDVTGDAKWKNLEIVGIVSNASFYNIRKTAPLTLYVPSIQYPDWMGWSDLLVQTKASPVALRSAIEQAVGSLGQEYAFSIKSVGQLIGKTILQERVTAMLSAFFGGLALLLAAVGLYGLMAYNVTQRTREIGIRLALGANRRSVQRMVLRETLLLALAGFSIGIPCALIASRFIASMLYGVAPHDAVTLALVSLVLLGAATVAGLLPARRAMRVDPIVALRYE